MSREDLEIKIPESDLKFLKEHGFHLVDEDTAEIVSKMVYFDLKEHHDEKISIMIVFSASFPGSYVMFRHETLNDDKETTTHEFTRKFAIGDLSSAFESIEMQVFSRMFFNEVTPMSRKIASMMSKAVDMNDEKRMIGNLNTYLV